MTTDWEKCEACSFYSSKRYLVSGKMICRFCLKDAIRWAKKRGEKKLFNEWLKIYNEKANPTG